MQIHVFFVVVCLWEWGLSVETKNEKMLKKRNMQPIFGFIGVS